MQIAKKKIRVLIVDDSALVRDILSKGLAKDPDIEVIGKAKDPYEARDMIVFHRPDVMTLDVEMPRMDGVEFLRKLMPQFPIPVIMVSALTNSSAEITLQALEAGAVDFVLKPSTNISRTLEMMLEEIKRKIKIASKIDVSHFKKDKKSAVSYNKSYSLAISTDKVVAIGASTGGTEAIKEVITRFPSNMPGVVIVQHMPAGFTKMFAERLNELCHMEVKEAQDGDRVMTGRILIAPGDFHMSLVRYGGLYKVTLDKSPTMNGHRPSVGVLFNSVAKFAGANALGIILTGMGNDGAQGMLEMRKAGAKTLAQDERSSVVWGMPKEAWKNGGAQILLPLNEIADYTMKQFSE